MSCKINTRYQHDAMHTRSILLAPTQATHQTISVMQKSGKGTIWLHAYQSLGIVYGDLGMLQDLSYRHPNPHFPSCCLIYQIIVTLPDEVPHALSDLMALQRGNGLKKHAQEISRHPASGVFRAAARRQICAFSRLWFVCTAYHAIVVEE